MEKMMYLIWQHETDAEQNFRGELMKRLSTQLIHLGARKLRVSIADEDVAPAKRLRMGHTKPLPSGLISIWVETAIRRRPLEKAMEQTVARMAGYLVTESEPIVNTKHVVPDGERTPGMCQVCLLGRPPRVNYEHWLDIWHNSHTQVAIDTQSTFGYRQNVIVRPLTYAAPPYDAIVEENFPAGAMTDQMVFFNADGDKEKFDKHRRAMMDSVARFTDFDKTDVVPMSEYTVKS